MHPTTSDQFFSEFQALREESAAGKPFCHEPRCKPRCSVDSSLKAPLLVCVSLPEFRGWANFFGFGPCGVPHQKFGRCLESGKVHGRGKPTELNVSWLQNCLSMAYSARVSLSKAYQGVLPGNNVLKMTAVWSYSGVSKSFLCWCSAGNEGVSPINHALWFPFWESLGSFPLPPY